MLDEEMKFKLEARRDKLSGQWAADQLGLSGAPADDYIRVVRNEGVVHKSEGVFKKGAKRFIWGIGISDGELRDIMSEFMSTCAREAQKPDLQLMFPMR